MRDPNVATDIIARCESKSNSIEIAAREIDIQIKEIVDQQESTNMNENGVDVDARTMKAMGRIVITIEAFKGVWEIIRQNPLISYEQQNLKLYFTAKIVPSSAIEGKATRCSHKFTLDDECDIIRWNNKLVFKGVRSKRAKVRIAVFYKSDLLVDGLLGETLIDMEHHLDQTKQNAWYVLANSIQRNCSDKTLKLYLGVQFTFSAQQKALKQLQRLSLRKKSLESMLIQYHSTAAQINSSVRHPAAFGKESAFASLCIPGYKFCIDMHHPAAVDKAPFPDQSRIATPFGRGIVISYRQISKIYIIKLDSERAYQSCAIAYLHRDVVREEPDYPALKVHMRVVTRYGTGVVDEIRDDANIAIVKLSFGIAYMQRQDIWLPPKVPGEMSTKELIEEAVSFTKKGNEQYQQNKLGEAVADYLRALGVLYRVQQGDATYKEKACILQTMIRCHLNIGASKLKLGAYSDAQTACTNAISILKVLDDKRHGQVVKWMDRLGVSAQLLFEEWPAKAHFRRAKAHIKLLKYSEARDDLKLAIKFNPKDKMCRTLLNEVHELWAKQKKEEKQTWGGIFGSEAKGKECHSANANNSKIADSDRTHEQGESVVHPKAMDSSDVKKQKQWNFASLPALSLTAAAFLILAVNFTKRK